MSCSISTIFNIKTYMCTPCEKSERDGKEEVNLFCHFGIGDGLGVNLG